MSTPERIPIHGTQSFVGIMGKVWDRPSLTALEIMWRWLPMVVLFASILFLERLLGIGAFVSPAVTRTLSALQSISVFQPVAAVEIMRAAFAVFLPSLRFVFSWLLVWNAVAALGRTLVLRRLDRTLHARRLTLFLLGTLRSALILGAWWFWLRLLSFAARTAITAPAARNEEPSVVLFAAMVIVGSLLLYCLWAAFSWFLHLAPLLAMEHNTGALAALRSAFDSGKTRGKLIEINLVMNIVRIALIVLAMVFSASPLPFTAVATPEFLHLWWAGVILLYLAASDYFHVVRAASYLSLYRAYNSTQAA